MQRIFRTRTFSRWMRKSGVSDSDLTRAVEEMMQGLVDADLGGHLLKKRVAVPGRGKRGGARTILATRMEGFWFFLFGFDKNERDNIDKHELRLLQEVARDLLSFDAGQLGHAIAAGELTEVNNDETRT